MEARGRGAYTVATIRGSSASQVSVFVDGVLMNLGTEDAVDLTTIPVDNVERIEVYRGYIPARFAGASMGGVINIITKKPQKQEGEISVGAGSYGKVKTNLAYSQPLGSGKFFLGANYEKSDGDFEYLNDNATEFTPGDDYWTRRQNNSYANKDILLKWVNDDWQFRFSWKENNRDQPYDAAGTTGPTVNAVLLWIRNRWFFPLEEGLRPEISIGGLRPIILPRTRFLITLKTASVH